MKLIFNRLEMSFYFIYFVVSYQNVYLLTIHIMIYEIMISFLKIYEMKCIILPARLWYTIITKTIVFNFNIYKRTKWIVWSVSSPTRVWFLSHTTFLCLTPFISLHLIIFFLEIQQSGVCWIFLKFKLKKDA